MGLSHQTVFLVLRVKKPHINKSSLFAVYQRTHSTNDCMFVSLEISFSCILIKTFCRRFNLPAFLCTIQNILASLSSSLSLQICNYFLVHAYVSLTSRLIQPLICFIGLNLIRARVFSWDTFVFNLLPQFDVTRKQHILTVEAVFMNGVTDAVPPG